MAEISAWMPLYIGDYLADTMHLSTEEHGAYMLLIMHYWRSGALPDDDRALAGITKVSRKEWSAEIGPTVRPFFDLMSDGRLHHKRIDAELAKAVHNSSKRRDAANARWKQTQSERNANASDVHDPGISKRHDPRAQSPSPSPRRKKDSVLRTGADGAVRQPDARDRLWSEGLRRYRALTGATEGKARSALGKLAKIANDDCTLVGDVLSEAEDARPVGDVFPWLEQAILARSDRREGDAERLAREFDFSIDDLPSSNPSGKLSNA